METCPEKEKGQEISKRRMQDVLPLAFFVMKCCGVWQPFDSSSILSRIYILYTIFVIFLMITVALSLLCVSLFSSENARESLADNSFLLFTFLNGWIKAAVFLTRRKYIESLLQSLIGNTCQPTDSVEVNIQREYDQEARQITRNYAILIACAIILMYFPIIFDREDERIRMLNVWRPYDLKVSFYFWVTYFHEVIGHFVTAYVHLSADILIPGLMMELSCQIQFLCHRLSKLSNLVENFGKPVKHFDWKKLDLETSLISKIILHHNILDTLTKEVNNIFVEVLFCQFNLSLFVICFCMFKIVTTERFESDTVHIFFYTFCMVIQLFIFCWYGNELMSNSLNISDAILETNWPFLEEKTKRSLIIIMIRCTKPFIISVGPVIFVHLEAFTSILKASYSAYNLLQQSM